MLSLGIDASRAFWMASAGAGLPSGSPPPSFAATVIARASLVNSLPRRASTIAFLCLIPAHFECPAMLQMVGHRPGRDPSASARARSGTVAATLDLGRRLMARRGRTAMLIGAGAAV